MDIRKIIKIILCNIFILVMLFFLFEFLIYNTTKNEHLNESPDDWQDCPPFGYNLSCKPYGGIDNIFIGYDGYCSGRLPDGLNYNSQPSIIIFGDSFAMCQYIDTENSFNYKLSESLKRTVHNRAGCGWSIQHMLYQTQQKELYEAIPNFDTVIYIMIDEAYKRFMLEYFDILFRCPNLHYSLVNDHLVIDNYENPFFNFIQSLYIKKYFNHKYTNYSLNHEEYIEKTVNNTMRYFIESRNNLEKHIKKKVNFVVIYYDEIGEREILLKKQLEQNGFYFFSTSDITDEELMEHPYLSLTNGHPTKEAWELLTPLIINKLKELKVI